MGFFSDKKQERDERKAAKLDEKFMREALKEAEKAAKINEVPIGCVIVQNGKVIAKGYNRRNTDKNVVAHAEMLAIQKACHKVGDWRLEDCTMYITLEPCQMCAGTIVQARIPKVVIGSMNPKAGCAGSVINLLQMQQFNHQVEIQKGVLQEECSAILTNFFADLRARKSQQEAEDHIQVEGYPDNAVGNVPAQSDSDASQSGLISSGEEHFSEQRNEVQPIPDVEKTNPTENDMPNTTSQDADGEEEDPFGV